MFQRFESGLIYNAAEYHFGLLYSGIWYDLTTDNGHD